MGGRQTRALAASAQESKENEYEPKTRTKSTRTGKTSTPASGRSSTPLNVLDLHHVLNSAEPTRHATKSKSRFSRAPSITKKARVSLEADTPEPDQITIQCLTPACLAEVFKRCGELASRRVLPLVCKQWAAVLKGPSVAWEVSFSFALQIFLITFTFCLLTALSFPLPSTDN